MATQNERNAQKGSQYDRDQCRNNDTDELTSERVSGRVHRELLLKVFDAAIITNTA
jgi:hypothetical protein